MVEGLHLVDKGVEQIVEADKVTLEAKHVQELGFLSKDVFRTDSLMSYLLGDDLAVQGIDVLILGRQVHGRHTDAVHVLVRQHDALLPLHHEPLVEDDDGKEVGTFGTLEAGADLDHPVGHLGAVLFSHLVLFERADGWLCS